MPSCFICAGLVAYLEYSEYTHPLVLLSVFLVQYHCGCYE